MGAPTSAAEISLLSRRLRTLIDECLADLAIFDVGGLTDPDAAAVEGLARLQLTAHRMGCDSRDGPRRPLHEPRADEVLVRGRP